MSVSESTMQSNLHQHLPHLPNRLITYRAWRRCICGRKQRSSGSDHTSSQDDCLIDLDRGNFGVVKLYTPIVGDRCAISCLLLEVAVTYAHAIHRPSETQPGVTKTAFSHIAGFETFLVSACSPELVRVSACGISVEGSFGVCAAVDVISYIGTHSGESGTVRSRTIGRSHRASACCCGRCGGCSRSRDNWLGNLHSKITSSVRIPGK